MSRTVIGTCKTHYQKTVTLCVSHYESSIADIQTCVEHIFCKDLENGFIAVYGSYLIFLLFTHEDFSGKQSCTHTLIRQTFSVRLKDSKPDASAFEVQFSPKATAHPEGPHTTEWTVDISADAKAVFFKDNPSKSDEAVATVSATPALTQAEPQMPPPPKAETPAAKHKPSLPAPHLEEQPADSSKKDAPATNADANPKQEKQMKHGGFWRIRSNAPVSAEHLLDMEEAHRLEFMENLSEEPPILPSHSTSTK
ncbi:MAG: hypothetical protein ABF449_04830 [Ethanoligenens sp.]